MQEYLKEINATLETIIAKLREELGGIRSNRPSVQMIEDIRVNYYDQMTPINQMGSISIGGPREIQVTVWDKASVNPVSGALQGAGMGLSVRVDGNTIRAFLPALSEERRTELGKLVKKMIEESRIQIRSRRDDVMKRTKAAEDRGELTEDDLFKLKEKIQLSVDNANKKAEELLQAKIKELEE
ncbi:MAG: ribosome-recycling factor [bacterium]|nr:ribosome-recycling factor [bacterium]